LTGPLLPAALLLIALGVFQWRTVRYVSYPPALFAFTWGMGLLLIATSGGAYDPMSDGTIGIFVLGGVLFAAGGSLGWGALAGPSVEAREDALPKATMPVLVLLVLALTPLYVDAIIRFVGQVSPAEFLYRLRVRSLESHITGGIGVIANAVPIAMAVALLAAALPARTPLARGTRGVALGLAILLTMLTGGRSAPLALIIGVVAIATARRRTVPWRPLLLATVSAIAVFGTMGVLVRKGTADPNADLRTNAIAIAENFRHYAIGGMVAFDDLVDDPRSVPGNGGFLRTAREIANKFGARHELPVLHQQFSGIGNLKETNVYTFYSSYLPEVGAAAMFALVLLLGVVTGAVHRLAVRGSLSALLFHGILAGAAVQSVFNEAFFMNLNFLAKLGAFALSVDLLAWLNGRSLAGHGGARRAAPLAAR
jgi:oligosaccharide repeat unit polymerase